MAIQWVLILSVCSHIACVSQEIKSYQTEAICEESKKWYVNFPIDGNSPWKSVEYLCKIKDSEEA